VNVSAGCWAGEEKESKQNGPSGELVGKPEKRTGEGKKKIKDGGGDSKNLSLKQQRWMGRKSVGGLFWVERKGELMTSRAGKRGLTSIQQKTTLSTTASA